MSLEPNWNRGLSRPAMDLRAQELEYDLACWWLREYAFAKWAAESQFPSKIATRVNEIGEMPKWRVKWK